MNAPLRISPQSLRSHFPSLDRPTLRIALVCCVVVVVAAGGACSRSATGADFSMRLPDLERVWIGPDYYGNRLQDWRIANGRVEAVIGDSTRSMRTLQLLTYALSEEPGRLEMSVRTGPIEPGGTPHDNTWAGFLIGAGGEDVDYRISALVHDWPAPDGGLIVALDGTGKVVVRDNTTLDSPKTVRANVSTSVDAWPLIDPKTISLADGEFEDVVLTLVAEPIEGAMASAGAAAEGDDDAAENRADSGARAVAGQTPYRLTVSVADGETGADLGGATYEGIDAEFLTGNVALVSHNSRRTVANPALAERAPRVFESAVVTTGPGYWFRDWRVGGSKVVHHPDRAFGPVMGAMHTLSDGTLKMTAQMGPVGADDTRTGELQVLRDGGWQTVATGEVVDSSYTMPFRVDNWDATVDTPYRVVYELRIADDTSANMRRTYTYQGTIRAEPHRGDFVLASMNCQHFSARPDRDASARGFWNGSGIWFPHAEVARAVGYHDPDMLFFAGDQIYEGGLAGIVREPWDVAALDYLYHWYWFIWSFRDLMRDIPTIATPDDHDVYQGNIWGAGGKRGEAIGDITAQDSGGYTMDPRWVNAVHRTQTSHHPDPPDPTPIGQGITVWYSEVNYGGVSMAVVSDRMFKSAPAVTVPDARIRNGWIQNPRFDPRDADVPDAVLLGQRQLDFLEDWAQDWSGGTWMKVLLSQTLFANLATIPADADSGAVLPGLEIPPAGAYVEGDKLAADADSGGWPQSGRNRALRVMRKAFAPHIAGDQHLGSVVQYGVDAFNDGPYAFVVPSVANLWPRRWYPPTDGVNRAPGAPRYTGEHFDGFGNRMTVHAVANPVHSGAEPSALYDRVPGYGIIRFDKLSRDIVFEAWPRWVDPSRPGAAQFAGWPVTFNQLDNYGGEAGHLATIEVIGLRDPVVQLIDEASDEVIYTVRIAGSSFRPKVFDDDALYTVIVGEPDTGQMQRLTGLSAVAGEERVEVVF